MRHAIVITIHVKQYNVSNVVYYNVPHLWIHINTGRKIEILNIIVWYIVCVFYAHKDLNAQRPQQRRNILRPSGHRVTKSRSMNLCTARPNFVGVTAPSASTNRSPAAVVASLAHLGTLPPWWSKHPQCLIVRCATTTGLRFPDYYYYLGAHGFILYSK